MSQKVISLRKDKKIKHLHIYALSSYTVYSLLKKPSYSLWTLLKCHVFLHLQIQFLMLSGERSKMAVSLSALMIAFKRETDREPRERIDDGQTEGRTDGLEGINSSCDISSGHTVDVDVFCEWKRSNGSFLSKHSASFSVCVCMCVCVSRRKADSQSKLWEFNLSGAICCAPLITKCTRAHTHTHTPTHRRICTLMSSTQPHHPLIHFHCTSCNNTLFLNNC